jgi:ribonuclease P protein component
MVRGSDFARTTRRGRRGGARRVVAHLDRTDDTGISVGFVVGKSVGNSVTRHRVIRQLRHIVAADLAELAPGTRLVVRALPAAKHSSSAELAQDLHRALERAAV